MEPSLPEPDVQPAKALFSPRDAAVYLGLSESTLARMRSRNSKVKGPPYFRLGGSVKYKQAELDAWVEHNREGADDATVGLVNGKDSKSGGE